ncbi:MAG: CoA-binding protein [Amaricoccus sp.]
MTVRNLYQALQARSVAVVGAGGPPGTAGPRVLAGILAGGFEGPVWPVDPGRGEVHGLPAFSSPLELPEAPDLAVVAGPAAAIPGLIGELGTRGCRLAVVLSEVPEAAQRQAMLDAARPHLLRVIGPGSDGLIVPALRLAATLAPTAPVAGELALVSQSGTVAAALVERAADHGIGLSCVLSLGGMADVDVGDCIDLLAGDGRTRAILLYLESVPAPRKFLSAARAAARVKPVIVLKAGRTPRAAAAAATHTGRLAGEEAVVEAALARAGVVRVGGLAELFAAAETLARSRPMSRARLAVVTNSGGAGVLAVDRLEAAGGTLAGLAAATVERLDSGLPRPWSGGNPVDIGSGAAPSDFGAALAVVAADRGSTRCW